MSGTLDVQILRACEELLKSNTHVNTDLLLTRIRREEGTTEEAAHDEVARATEALVDDGYLIGKVLRGDMKVMDVTVTRVTEKGLDYLWSEGT